MDTITASPSKPVRLIYRSLSGRTEIAVLEDGTVTISVINRYDTISNSEVLRLLASLTATSTETAEGAQHVR